MIKVSVKSICNTHFLLTCFHKKKVSFSKTETIEENPLPLSGIVSGEPGIKLNAGYWAEFSIKSKAGGFTPDIFQYVYCSSHFIFLTRRQLTNVRKKTVFLVYYGNLYKILIFHRIYNVYCAVIYMRSEGSYKIF